MGRKVNPLSFRMGSRFNWTSRWYAKNHKYGNCVAEDIKIRKHLTDQLSSSAISSLTIERFPGLLRVTIHSSKPGVIIGKRGEEADGLRKCTKGITPFRLEIFVVEVKKAESDATLIANTLAGLIEKRMTFRRAIKRLVMNALKQGAHGIKVVGSGRLSGAEIARQEWYKDGKIPLHTVSADIDYAASVAKTTYGTIGLKVWVYKGDWTTAP